MSGIVIDWSVVATWVITTTLCSFIAGFILRGFALLLFYQVKSDQTVQTFAKAAQRFTGAGKGGGGLLDKIGSAILKAVTE